MLDRDAATFVESIGARVDTDERGPVITGPVQLSSDEALTGLRHLAGSVPAQYVLLGTLTADPASRVAEHDRVGRLAIRIDTKHLVVVGAAARPMYAGAFLEGSFGGEIVFAETAQRAADDVQTQLREGVLWVAGNTEDLVERVRRVIVQIREESIVKRYGGADGNGHQSSAEDETE